MLLIKYLAVILHIVTAAAYFGMGLLLARQARAFAVERTASLGEIGLRAARLMTMFAVLTFVFGLVAFLTGGGFAFYPPQFHISLTVILVLIAVHIFLVQGSWKKLAAAVSGGTDATSPAKRVAMGVGIAHLIWLILLVLMFWGQLTAGFAQL